MVNPTIIDDLYNVVMIVLMNVSDADELGVCWEFFVRINRLIRDCEEMEEDIGSSDTSSSSSA